MYKHSNYNAQPDPPHNPMPGDIWRCPELDNTFIWNNGCWVTLDSVKGEELNYFTNGPIGPTGHQRSTTNMSAATNMEKPDPGISPNDFDFFTFEMWLNAATPEELEAYDKLGQNYRVSTSYVKSLTELKEPEPKSNLLQSTKSLDDEYEQFLLINNITEWKIEEIMKEYEDDLEDKLLFDVIQHYENTRTSHNIP